MVLNSLILAFGNAYERNCDVLIHLKLVGPLSLILSPLYLQLMALIVTEKWE